MLIFEHSRTESIVSRLVRLANIFRLMTILFCVIFWAGFLGWVTNQLLDGAWFIGAIAGAILGYLLGLLEAALIALVMEWMGQVLIAQGEIIRRTAPPK